RTKFSSKTIEPARAARFDSPDVQFAVACAWRALEFLRSRDPHLPWPAIPRTEFMECPAGVIPGSLRLDARELDYLGPLLGFVRKELAVVGGRARNRRAALFGKPRLDLRIGKARVDLTIQLIDDFGRRVLGGAKSQPSAC